MRLCKPIAPQLLVPQDRGRASGAMETHSGAAEFLIQFHGERPWGSTEDRIVVTGMRLKVDKGESPQEVKIYTRLYKSTKERGGGGPPRQTQEGVLGRLGLARLCMATR